MLSFNDMSKHSLVSWLLLLLLLWVWGGGGRGVGMFFLKKIDGKSVMSMFCNVIMLLLLYVHVCVTGTGWKTRPRPKTVLLSIKKSINQSVSLYFFLVLSKKTNTGRLKKKGGG